jgi:amino acid transporter
MSLRDVLLGRPLRDDEADEERIGTLEGVPVLGLDGLASAAYGPEAALSALLPLGAAAPGWAVPIVLAVVGLLLVVQVSYRQTIAAYPNGGGSYTVASENLGPGLGLVAAAALAIDYVLNVAVAISAGVGALVSALPPLLPWTLPLCLALLLVLVVANLRGVRSAGLLFALPTYAFVACLGIAIAIGAARALGAGGHPAPVAPPHPLAAAVAAPGAWLLLHAFASGCTAMTGVEAVSNGVTVFRAPRVVRARRTLAAIVAILAALLVGLAVLSRAYGVGATPAGEPGYESVLSQLVGAVAGRGWFYGVAIGSTVAVLCLSANTSFAGFPRLCRVLAVDEYLPEAFAHAGRRLVYSTGVLVLGALAAALLVAFGGLTDRLIPLFAVGAFAAFTLSQLGMVAHWRRVRGPGAGVRLAVNGVGAALTAAALAVIVAAKLAEGAWVSLALVVGLVVLFRRTRADYEGVRRATSDAAPLELEAARPPVVIVPVKRLDRVTRKALRFALCVSPEVHAVQVIAREHARDDVSRRWAELVEAPARAAGIVPPRLVVLRSEYRQVLDPIAGHVRRLAAEDPARFVAVVVPELVERRWYHYLLHSHTATVLKTALLFRAGPQVAIVNTPWFLSDLAERRLDRRWSRWFHRRSHAPHAGLSTPRPAR